MNPANSGTAGNPITFTASPGVTISGGTKAFALSGKSYIIISGFTITGTSSYGIYISAGSNDIVSGNTLTGTGSHAIYLSGGSNNTVSGNTESYAGTPQQGLSAYGIWLNNETSDLVNGNITHDNSAHGIYLSGTTTGATVAGNTSYHNAYQWQRNANGINDIAPGNSIIGNVMYANEDSGVNIYPGGDNALVADNVTYGNGDHGIDDLNVTGGRIIGNTVYGNCSDGINVEGTSSNYLIENNLSDNNATGAEIKPTIVNYSPYKTCAARRNGNIGVYDQTAPGTTTADYNLVYQTGSAPDFIWGTASYTSWQAICQATGQECHSVVADPQLVNAGAGNFQLTAGSPAIDKANTAVSGEQPTDILGTSPYDDLGAYEYAGGGTQTGPTAQLAVSPPAGTAPVAVTADASASTAGSSPISSYSFDFGDGTTVGPQPGATAGHSYPAPGSYVVKVTVTDGNGLTSAANQTVTVNPQATGPTAQLSVTPSSGTAPVAVTADASASTAGSSPISSYSFDFGDGTTVGPQPGATAGHSYPAPGSYVVKVTVTDGNGLTSQASQTVTVSSQSSSPAKYVSQIATNYSTSSHTSSYVTVYRTTGVAAGDMIIATVQLTGTSATGAASGTDSKGDTLNVVSDVSDGTGDRLITVAGTTVNGLAANDTITIRFPTASSYHMAADEVSGVTSVDQQSAASGTSSAFSSGSTGSTARSGEFVYATVATFGGTSLSWDSGWTALTSYPVGSTAIGRAYQIPQVTGTSTGSGTASGSWLAAVVTFK